MTKTAKRLVSLALVLTLIVGLFAVPMGGAQAACTENNWVTSYDNPDINGDGTIKVLFIGNSYASNVRHILQDYYLPNQNKKVILAAAYIGFSGMYSYYRDDKGAEFYSCQYNTNEVTQNPDIYGISKNSVHGYRSGVKYRDAVSLTDWDIIVLQESPYGAADSTQYESYLSGFVSSIKQTYAEAHGDSAKMSLAWFMTWSVPASIPGGTGGSDYEGTNLDEYNRISANVNNYVAASGEFDAIYACATAIQNTRTADTDNYVSADEVVYDGLCTDNLHVVSGFSRYMVAYAFMEFLGLDTSGYDNAGEFEGWFSDCPEAEAQYRANRMELVMKESVANAMANPQTVTQSIYTGSVAETCNDGAAHSYSAASVVAPSCEADGYTVQTCSKCKFDYIYDIVDMLGHSYVITKQQDATCTKNGYIYQYCSRCNEQNNQTLYGGHTYGGWEVIKESTYTETGVKRKTCTVCGEYYEEAIPLLTDNVTYDIAFESQEEFNEFSNLVIKADNYGGNYTADSFMYFSEEDMAYITSFVPTDTGASKANQLVAIKTPGEGYGKTFTMYGGGGYSYDETTAAPGVIYAHDDYGYYGIKAYVTSIGAVAFQHFYMTQPSAAANGYSTNIVRGETLYPNIVTVDGEAVEEESNCVSDVSVINITKGNNNQQFFTYKYYVTADETGTVNITVDLIYDDLISAFTATTETLSFTVDNAEALVTSALHTNYKPAFGFFKHSYGKQLTYTDMEGNSANHDHDSRVYSIYAEYAECEHTYTSPVEAVEATCEKAGKTASVVCDFCGETVSGGAEIAALGHDFVVNYTVEPTCTEGGTATTTCNRCDYYKTADVPANGHKYDVFNVTKEATCTEDGSGYGTCTVCKNEITEVLPAFGHSYSDWVIDKAATTEAAGQRHKTCSTCNDTVSEVIPKIVYDVNYNWDFEGADGEANSAELLASGSRYIGYGSTLTTAGTYITAGYDAESAAFELAVPRYFGTSGIAGNLNAIILDTAEGTTPTTFSFLAGNDDRDSLNSVSTPGVAYAKDDSGIHYFMLAYKGAFKLYSYKISTANTVTTTDEYTQIKTSSSTLIDGVGTYYKKVLKNGETAKYEYIKDDATVTVYADRSTLNSTEISSYFSSYSLLQKYFGADLPAISQDVLKTSRTRYAVEVKDGVTTITPSTIIKGTEGNTYEIVWMPITLDNEGNATYTSSSAGATTSKTFAGGVIGNNYEIVFGAMQYSNTGVGDTHDQIYSLSAYYAGNTASEDGGSGDDTHTHSYKASNTVAATCTSGGYTVYTCECGASYNGDTVAALGHDYQESTVDATCTAAGSTTTTCSRCDYSNTVTIPATGHTMSEYTVTTEATCTTSGIKTGTCSVCGATATEEIPATGHSYGDYSVNNEATCTQAGEKAKTCGNCGDIVTEEIPALGHSYGDWVIDKEATETTTGLKSKTCSACGDKVTEVIPVITVESGYDWNFEGTGGEMQAADMLANSTHIAAYTGSSNTGTTPGAYLTAGYDSGSAAFELAVPYSVTDAGISKILGNLNAIVLDTPDGGTPTSFNIEVGTDDATTANNTYSGGVIYARDDGGIHAFVVTYKGGFKVYDYYLKTSSTIATTDDYIERRIASSSALSGIAATFQKVLKNGEVLADRAEMSSSDAVTYLGSYSKVRSNYASALPSSLTAADAQAMRVRYDVTVSNGVTTITPSIVITVDSDVYELVLTPVTVEGSTLTYMKENTADAQTATKTVGENSEAIFGVMQHGNTGSANVNVQVYSVSATYEVGGTGGDTHTHSYEAEVTAPTCTEGGYTTYTCSCGESYKADETVALGHDYKTTTIDATCTEAGSTTITCSRCDYNEVTETAALGHTESGWVTDKEASETEEGSRHTECTVCGETLQTEAIPMLTRKTGDANGDGTVDVMDAVAIARYCAALTTLDDISRTAADVDGNGIVNVLDAVIVSRYAAGIIDEFTAE